MFLHHQKYPIEPYRDVNISVMLIYVIVFGLWLGYFPKNEWSCDGFQIQRDTKHCYVTRCLLSSWIYIHAHTLSLSLCQNVVIASCAMKLKNSLIGVDGGVLIVGNFLQEKKWIKNGENDWYYALSFPNAVQQYADAYRILKYSWWPSYSKTWNRSPLFLGHEIGNC